MENNNQLTITTTGSMLMGAGLTQITSSLNVGLILIGVGVLLQVMVAYLNKKGISIQSNLG